LRLLLTLAVIVAACLILAASVAAHNWHRPHGHDRGCNTNACDDRIDRWLDALHKRWRLWYLAHHQPWGTAVASWFDDSGSTACGMHYLRGLASRTLGCGQAVHLCYHGCEVAHVEDRGPFVDGRLFDLNPGARDAIDCTDLCGREGGRLTWYVR